MQSGAERKSQRERPTMARRKESIPKQAVEYGVLLGAQDFEGLGPEATTEIIFYFFIFLFPPRLFR